MFIDFELDRYIGYDKKSDTDEHQIKIIDSDFIKHICVSNKFSGMYYQIAVVALIKTYEKLNLNVAHNLYLLCRNISEYSGTHIINIFQYYENSIEEYFPYREQVLNYHIRYNKQKAFW